MLTNRSHSPLYLPLLIAVCGILFSVWNALDAASVPCVSAGCTLYQNFSINGYSLWWGGVGIFSLLGLLAITGHAALGRWLAGLAVLLDCVLLGIMISQAFMLAGFLLVALYFVFDVLSRKEYEYILDGKTLTIDVIYGKRYRNTAHIIDMTEMEVTAPNRHEAVAKYRKDGGGVRLPKFDYTSYEDDIPYNTMIVIEDREKKKLLLDLNQELLFALKKQYPSKVFA